VFLPALALIVGTALMSQSIESQSVCKKVISEKELHKKLAEDPKFAGGVPPAGHKMRIERLNCGYAIFLGHSSPDEIGNIEYVTDADGKIIDTLQGY